MKHDYLESSLWYRETITDPYQVIAAAFDFSDISFYRKVIKGVLLLATQPDKRYDKDNPANLLFEFTMIESVINAAYVINKEKRKSPLTIGADDLFNKNLYCGQHAGRDEWDYFPRSLSRKEFIDPYLVFKRFFRFRELKEWKDDLQEILNRALSKSEERLDIDVLPIYLYLTKLLEAAHLIDVREITHVGGWIKNRF